MQMNYYNGFTPTERQREWDWQKACLRNGMRTWPLYCDACGAPETKWEAALHQRVLMPHSEDYSEPFGPQTGAYHLCRRCHVNRLHTRFSDPDGWHRYRREVNAINRGRPDLRRDFYLRVATALPGTEIALVVEEPGRSVLDDVHEGLLVTRHGVVRVARRTSEMHALYPDAKPTTTARTLPAPALPARTGLRGNERQL